MRAEQLEDRTVPTVLDLATAAGASGDINGAIFTGATGHNSGGSGNIDSIVRITNTGVEQGYNTDASPYQTSPITNNAGSTATFNHSVQLSSVPVVVKGGIAYYEFVLDINQNINLPYLSLDELRLYVSPSSLLNYYNPSNLTLAVNSSGAGAVSPVYDMDGGADPSDLTYVKLNSGFNSGSGSVDVFIDIPVAKLGNDTSQYVYLYSKFGVQHLNDQILGGTGDAKNGGSANDGFEEWAYGIGQPVQLPGSISTVIYNGSAPAVSPVSLGSVAYDTSAITYTLGNPIPAGTVTYQFFPNSTATGTPVFTQTVTVNADGTVPHSQDTAALAAGSYSFIATYNPAPGSPYASGTSDVEPLTVAGTTSSVATTIYNSATNQPISGTLLPGTSVYDTSTVTGGNGTTVGPTGTVTYFFYPTINGTGTPIYEKTFALPSGSANPKAAPNSDTQGPLVAGSYSFVVQYSGDSNYGSSTSPVEPLTISKLTTTTTTDIHLGATDGVTPIVVTNGTVDLGSVVHDLAQVASTSGSGTPTGTVTFQFWQDNGPVGSDPSDTLLDTSAALTLSGGVVDTAGFAPTGFAQGPLAAGYYYFTAAYSGDGNYAPSATTALELLTVKKAQLAITTAIHDASHSEVGGATHVALGSVVHDTATVTGQVPGFDIGAISFTLDGSAVANDPSADGTATARSVASAPLAAGGYTYAATVAANANYLGATSAPEPLTVSQATTTTATDIHLGAADTNPPTVVTNAAVALGSVVHDLATVASANGYATPTGSVTFQFWQDNGPVGSDPSDTLLDTSAALALINGAVDATAFAQRPLTAGHYYFTASYSGDANHAPSQTTAPELLTCVDGTIALNPLTADNAVGQAHTITATVRQDLGDGRGFVAAPGAPVVFTVTGDTSGLVYTDPNLDHDNNPLTAITDASGQATLTFTRATAGTVTVHAATTFEVDATGILVTRATGDGLSGDSPDATKTYVDAYITIASDKVNGVGDPHTFTVTVYQDDGLTAAQGGDGVTGFKPAAFAPVEVTLTNQNGAGAWPAGPFNGTADASGQFQVTFASATAGQVIGSATTGTGFVVNGVPLTRTTDGVGLDSGPAVKTYVDATIALSPLTADNAVGQAHTVTATVRENLGDGQGFVAAPGAPVVFTVTGDTAGLVYTDPNLDHDNNPLTAVTDAGGHATLTFTRATAGSITVHAATTFAVDSTGVTLTRATGDGLSGDSGNAVKNYVDARIAISPLTPNNAVGDAETFTITVTAFPAGTGTPTFATPTVSFPGATPGTATGPTVLAPPAQQPDGSWVATWTETINSATAGTFTVQASDQVTMDSVTVTRTTGDSLSGDSGNAVKNYVSPAIQIVKYVNGNDANSPPGISVPAGSTLTFTYAVTNTGNVSLTNVAVADSVLGTITSYTGDNGNGLLDPGETWTYTATATAQEGQHTNIGTATGKDTVLGTTVTASDPANYTGAGGQVNPVALSSLSGYVYVDSNNNGIRERREKGIAKVTVILIGVTDQGVLVQLITRTNKLGYYQFAPLPAGHYIIQEVQPRMYRSGKDTVGTQGGYLIAKDRFFIALGAGVFGRENNFGELVGKQMFIASNQAPMTPTRRTAQPPARQAGSVRKTPRVEILYEPQPGTTGLF